MSNPYTLENLADHLGTLNLKIQRMKQLEYVIDNYWKLQAASVITGPALAASLLEEAEASITSQSELGYLGDIPERCQFLVGLDPRPFQSAQTTLEEFAADVVELEDDPGNILNKVIGSWYGTAAGEFEDYFSAYENTQLIQAELYVCSVNACSSIFNILTASNASIGPLLAGAIDLADKIISSYEDNLEALTVALVVTVLGVLAGGLGFIAAAGAAVAAVGAVAGGTSALISGAYQIDQIEAALEAQDADGVIDTLSTALAELETAFHQVDDEVATEIEKVQNDWAAAKIAIPAPPGGDEVNPESFHHESSL